MSAAAARPHCRAVVLALCVCAVCACACARATVGSPRRAHARHVLLVVADDLGWADVGFHGAGDVHTPHLDALAARGAVAARYYTPCVCSPARATLLTGRAPAAHGVTSWLRPTEATALPLGEALLPQALAAHGRGMYSREHAHWRVRLCVCVCACARAHVCACVGVGTCARTCVLYICLCVSVSVTFCTPSLCITHMH